MLQPFLPNCQRTELEAGRNPLRPSTNGPQVLDPYINTQSPIQNMYKSMDSLRLTNSTLHALNLMLEYVKKLLGEVFDSCFMPCFLMQAYSPHTHKTGDTMNTKEITILHSNDMHGDFIAEIQGAEGKLIGGLGRLAGYLNKVRAETPNTLYVISGDMVQGSLIDSEYKGISTIEIMNYLAPDVVTLGNHELGLWVGSYVVSRKDGQLPHCECQSLYQAISPPAHAAILCS